MLKDELRRGLKGINFKIMIFIGIFLCIAQTIKHDYSNIIMSYNNYNYFFDDYIKNGIVSSYESFIFFKLTDISKIFFMIMPVLVSISYANSYLEDLNSGFLKSILIRCPKNKYFICKYIANFIIAGATIAIPLIIDLLIVISTQASIIPDMIRDTNLINGNLNLNMYMHHPVLYIVLWIFIYFIFAGAIASIVLSFSIFIRDKFIVTILPFLLVQAINIIFGLIGLNKYNLSNFLFLCTDINLMSMFITFFVMLMLTFLSFFIGGRNNEAF
ncbi:MAG: hypothetical protein ACERKV_04200 [Clostridiaceae bacterium]